MLKINNNKLIRSFVEVIASQWSKAGIETVEDAMNIAEEEYKKKKKVKEPTKKVKETPEWFNKDIKEEEATLDEIKKLEERMKRS